MFADDTRLHDSDKSECLPSLVAGMEACITDVKCWMTQNKLQLNDGKTEALLISGKITTDFPRVICIGQNNIVFSHSVRNLGVMFDDKLSLSDQVTKVCQRAYLELRKIGHIRHYLTLHATKTLVSSLVLSHLDYCNILLAGLPRKQTDKLQRVQNCAARLVYKISKQSHVTPLLIKLHWLPISERIEYKIAMICNNIYCNSAPHYLSELLHLYKPSRSSLLFFRHSRVHHSKL